MVTPVGAVSGCRARVLLQVGMNCSFDIERTVLVVVTFMQA